MKDRHFHQWRDAITQWDNDLEKEISHSERKTLECLNFEKSESRRLKKEFNSNKVETKARYASATDELKRKLDESQAELAKKRDGILEKLETQRATLNEFMLEFREWVGMRTGNMALQEHGHDLVSDKDKELYSIRELSAIAKEFESEKKAVIAEVRRLRSHPIAKLSAPPSLLVSGLSFGALAAFLTWILGISPIFVTMIGVIGTIIAAFVLFLVSAPLLGKTIKRLLPNIVQKEQRANQVLNQGRNIAESNYQAEYAKHAQAAKLNQQKLDAEYKQSRTQLVDKYNSESAQLKADCKLKRLQSSKQRIANQEKINFLQGPKTDQIKKQHSAEHKSLAEENSQLLSRLEAEFVRSQAWVVSRWRSGVECVERRMQEAAHAGYERLPSWDSDCYVQGKWPRHSDSVAWRLGSINPNRELFRSIESLNVPVDDQSVQWPIFFDLLSHGSLIIESDAESKDVSNLVLRNVLARAITSLPSGALQTTIIDPEGLGKQYSWLMSLADVDPTLVNHRVWTQPIHIADQLSLAARHVEDIIQQSLRDRYENLVEYNQMAGPMAVPFRLLVWSNFPVGMDDHAWQSLCSILSSGGKCGVGVLLQLSNTYVWPSFADRSKLSEFGLHLKMTSLSHSSSVQTSSNADASLSQPGESQDRLNKVRIVLDHPEFVRFPLAPEIPPADEKLQEIMEHHIASLSEVGKRIVPFDNIAISVAEQQTISSAEGLSIPIGIADSGRPQSLKLGAGTAQHVLIAGKTGSGKSSLLHTMITSAATKYSPQMLRLVLLDFKKGVEFQVYAESALSHADIIGIESKREFGVSVLEYLDKIMHARGEAFRQFGVQDLPSLARKHPNQSMPRILVLIDEFQELFVEDDKLSQQASMLMDRIVRQGRSFGIHLVLASQTLGGAYSLPRTTLSQMAVRIALHCDSSDAMLILSEDNTAAERLRHSGQAIYNDGGGRFESNQNFQVAYIDKNSQLARLQSLSKSDVPRSPTTNPLGRQIVFEGHKPAVWDSHQLEISLSKMQLDSGTLPIYLGESVSIDPPIIKVLTKNVGRNVMVVGADEASAASLLAGAIAGFQNVKSSETNDVEPQVFLLDGTRNEDVSMKKLIQSVGAMTARIRVAEIRNLDDAMQAIQSEFTRRNDAPQESYPPVLIAIANIARFRELRRADDFSFGDDASGSAKPDAVLANLLKDGPALGMYVWIWADSASTMTRWISRQSLRDIEIRILMQMSSSDSNQLIDSNAANRLDPHVALVHDDIEGKAIKFRPYALTGILQPLCTKEGSALGNK